MAKTLDRHNSLSTWQQWVWLMLVVAVPTACDAKAMAFAMFFIGVPLTAFLASAGLVLFAHYRLAVRRRWILYVWVFALLWLPVPIQNEVWTATAIWFILGNGMSRDVAFALSTVLLVGGIGTLIVCWSTADNCVSVGKAESEPEQ